MIIDTEGLNIQAVMRRILTDYYPEAVRVEVTVTHQSTYVNAEYRDPDAMKKDCISMRKLRGDWV